ncbi:MAG TPA: Ig-like domain-containing protein, partial [Verrucomicrobiae bacterium]|nr:Ig-like domain-containing protein [Verrucomicrobiae bacterium]
MPKFLYGTTTSRGGFWRAGRSALALAGLVGVGPTALAVDSTFPLAGAPVLLSQVTNNEAAIFYQSMRFNRGLNAWNVEAWVGNQSTRTLQGPLVLRIESFANTTGPIDADGKDNSGMPFYDLTANVTAGRLEPGQRSLARTLTLARGAGAPSLQAHLFEKRNSTALTVAITRTLNEVGQPLPGVQVIDLQTSNTNLTEPDFGAITLTGTAGPQAWKFAAPGFLPVWRQETLSSSSILTVPSPRLTPMDTNTVTLTPIDGGSIGTGTVRVSFPPGAFVQNSTARLTLLTSQTLPAPLPLGWSPLQGFWLQFGAEPAIAGPGTLVPWGVIGSGEVATLVHWNETNLQWQVVQAVAGNGTNAVSVSIAGSGAFALVVADTGPAAPPPMQPGQNLDAAIGNAVDYGLLKVAGSVQPASGPANRNPDLVTATALLNVTSSAGALTSGLMLHVQIHEDYRLRDGTHRITPPYDTFVLAYQRPPTGNPGSLVASFPLRPLLLFGPEALDTAIIEANVFGPTNFNGALLDSSGGELYNEGIRIVAATGDVSGLQASSLRSLSPTNFLDWSSNGVSILRAFDLTVAGVQQGRRLVFQAEALPTNALFVLAKVLSRDGVYGLEPRERLISDGAGRVSSLEPPAGPSLPGITGAGEYVLVQVSAGQGLVKGVARNSSGQPSAGLLVQTTGAPWATLSDSGGNYTLIAATGSVQLSILELSSGDRGQVTTLLSGATGVANADLAPIVSGLLATLVTPTNGAVGVPSVSPVVVSFSSAINPGSFGTNGIELLDNSNMMVAGNLSLNLQNTVATLLPNSPLAAGIQHTVVVSTNLTSVNGQALAGVTKFTFTTASDALNRTAGQLISYEPTNGVARVEGGPGIADANAPVILLNETTGRSSTVLSNPDGSITNSIEAEVDDFISVVLVNQNGTRQTVPVSRQIYNDGSVGLFNAGGILEAQSDAGPIQVIVEPGAIPSKTRFNLQLQSMDQILAAVGGILPENAAIVGGLRIDVSGDALQQQMDFTYPISAEALHLGVNERPEDRAFVLCQPIQVDGVTVYNIVDRMHYENGRLVTHSPPFPGLLSSSLAVLVEYSVGFSVSLTVSGRVGAALDTIATSLSDAQITAGSPSTTPPIFGVPFPIVTADPGSTAGAARPGLRPGTFVARGNSQGYFAMLIPFNVYDSDAIALRATSGNLPGLVGRKTIVPPPAGAPPVSTAGIVIPLPQGTSSGVLDMMPPLIGALPQSAVLPVNQDARVTFNVRDNLTQPTLRRVEVDLAHSFHVLTGQLLDPSEFLTPQIGAVSNINATTIEVPVVFNVRTAAVVVAKATAQDAANNFRTSSFVLFFGAPPSGPSTNAITSSDPNDTAGPYVVSSVPGAGEVISANDFFTIRFSEPVDPSITTNGAVQISGISNLPYVELSANQLQIKVYPGGLSQGQSYTLTINNRVKDLSGNAFDQDPTTPAQEPFELNFRTAPATPTSLSQIQNGAGTVLLGEFAYTIDRRDNQANGALVSANLQDPSNITFSSATLPPYPRTLVLIPGYNFKRTPGAVTQTNTALLLVAGGLIGPDQPGQWLWVFDLSEPSNPVRLAGSLATLDPVTALSVVKWDPPRLSLGLNPAEGGYIEELNLQAFILGSNYGDQDWAAAKKPPANGGYFPGVDGNGDGDYVDAGDQLPVPMRSGLFGLEATTYAAANRILTDFDSAFGGALLVATLGRQGTNESRFQVLTYQGQPVGDGSTDQGSVVFTNRQAFRVVLDPSFPIRDATGVRVASVAIVAVDDKLALIDLTNPVRPQIVNSIGLGTNAGTIFSIQRSGADEYAVSTGAAIYTLRRSLMSLSANSNSGSPAIIDVYPTGSNRRSFGAAGVQFVAANGNGVQLVERPPHLSVIQVPTQPPRSASEIKALGDPEISQYVSDAVESPFLLPTVVVPVSPACPEGIASANPASHHYVLISAKGGLGPQLTVAAESLDAQGRLITPKSSWFPPVMLTDKAPALGLAGAQPDVHALVARRLSDDPKSRFYDLFLSDPFVLVRETLWPSNMTQLQAISGREALWSGNFARFSLEPDQGPPRLSSYLGAIDGKTFKPGLSRTYLSLSGQYLGTPNPSFNTASPDIAGVNAQSGEFHQKTVDFSLPGRHQDLVLTRTYASRSRFAGPLGGGWDFNYNARLFEIPQIDVPAGFHDCMTYFGNSALDRVAGPGDVLLIDGVGDVNLFKLISAENNNLTNLTLYSADPALAQFGYTSDNIGAWYCSPEGEFFVLYKFKDNSWMTVSPAGVRAYFRADGQLRQIIGVYADSRISLLYRPDGKLSRVTGDRGQYLEFGYYGLAGETSGNVDQVTSKRLEVGLIARIQANEAAGVVGQTDYSYDENGDLLTVAPQNESLMKYGYDPTPPHQITALGRVDGTEWPAETIHYSDGLVDKVTNLGQDISYGGALKTAKDCYDAPERTVTVKIGDYPAATIKVDNRGRPTEMANRTVEADDSGRITKTGDDEASTVLTYDKDNAVYRFRGHLLRAEQPGKPAFVTTFGYDGSAFNRVSSITNTEGIVTSFEYDSNGNYVDTVLETTGPVKKTYHLNNFGQCTDESIEDSSQSPVHTLTHTFAFDDEGMPNGEHWGELPNTTATFTAGKVSAFGNGTFQYTPAYTSDDQLQALSGTGLPTIEFGHQDGFISSHTISSGSSLIRREVTFDANDKKRVKSVTTTETGLPVTITTASYDGNGRVQSLDTDGEHSVFTFAGSRVTGLRAPGISRLVSYRGSQATNLTEQGISTDMQYDDQGRLSSLTRQGVTATFVFNSGNQVANKTLSSDSGPLEQETYMYDGAGRLESTEAGGVTRTFTHFGDGSIRRFSIDGNALTEWERDSAGRLTALKLPGLAEFDFASFDAGTGQPKTETIKYFPSTGGSIAFVSYNRTLGYDAAGRLASVTWPCGTWNYEYDDFGNLTNQTDPDGVSRSQSYSPDGALLGTIFTDGSSVSYTYDSGRRLQSVGAMSFELDSEKLVSHIAYPDATTSDFLDRNQFFEPQEVVHGGIIQNISWNEDGRLEQINVPNNGDSLNYDYDGLGRITNIVFNDYTLGIGYDNKGQLNSETTHTVDPSIPDRMWSANF